MMTLTSQEVASWCLPGQAPIGTVEEMASLIADWRKDGGKPNVILTSGGFDPVHPGHISCIQDSKTKVDEFHQKAHGELPGWPVLIVVVNDTDFLLNKKGVEFMPLKARCQVISALREVDFVVPFGTPDPSDTSVCGALELIKPNYFTKGGDRGKGNVPEEPTCEKHGIEIVYGCGDDKYWSSSSLLDNYRNHIVNQQWGME